MTPPQKYTILSCVSGVVWGCFASVIAFDAVPRTIWGGLVMSPVIGLLIGMAMKHWSQLATSLRITATLLSLYVAAALFGLAVGIFDWLAIDIPNRIAYAVVVQSVLTFLWGITFTGYLFVLWLLAYLNHWMLARTSPASQIA